MTPEQVRIAMAEVAGFKLFDWGVETPQFQTVPRGMRAVIDLIPNYPEDLNAVHEVEKSIKTVERLWRLYGYQLLAMCSKANIEIVGLDVAECSHATALQRCEAILRTLGKWKK